MPVQLVPLRSLTRYEVARYNVMSFEGPWNCGTVFAAIKREMGWDKTPGNPSFRDIILFGSEWRCRDWVLMTAGLHPQALAIDAAWADGWVTELGPNMNEGVARQGVTLPRGVVLDTDHWRELGDQAEATLEMFGGRQAVRMVHLKLKTEQETRAFLKGEGENDRLLRMFLAEDRGGDIPVVIEAKGLASLRVDDRTPMYVLRDLERRIRHIID
jgi:hypothetical protein